MSLGAGAPTHTRLLIWSPHEHPGPGHRKAQELQRQVLAFGSVYAEEAQVPHDLLADLLEVGFSGCTGKGGST